MAASTTQSAHAFTPDAARALAGPDWLADRRLQAAERLAAAEPPTTEAEIWRYSRIDEFDPSAWRPAALPPVGEQAEDHAIPVAVRSAAEQMVQRSGLVVAVNGRVVHAELDPALESKGVMVGDAATECAEEAREDFGAVTDASPDWFTDLHDAFTPGGPFVAVPAGVVVDRPILVFQFVDGPDGSAAFPHTLVVAGEGSHLPVLEHRSSGGAGLLSSAVAEIAVGDNANVDYLSVQHLGRRTFEVALQRAHLGRNARLTSGAVALGGSYARLRSESMARGEGSEAKLLAVYFADGDQMLDFRTLQDHEAPRSSSDLLFKGAVEHRAHSVYSGLIRLRETAQKAGAHQTNRTLKLSRESHAESVPNLEILANDVQCTHASAIGPIDPDELYYLESRGIPPAVAEQLVVTGFFEDVFARLPLGALVAPLRQAVAEKFARRDRDVAEEVRGA
ncbi:MAG TPA: Fe-S cluster assembly protein SufD [Acidimicrobiia bacterium]|nr:Fe-S cluster assembly protein SufD [Acidimicrobiia bacterium]